MKKEDVIGLLGEVKTYLTKVQKRNLVYMNGSGINLSNVPPSAVFPTHPTPQAVAAPVLPPTVSNPSVDPTMSPEMLALKSEIEHCQKCELSKTRKHAVFGNGNVHADLVFIGEAPRVNEDRYGIPFCGSAGNLLNQELNKNGVRREEVFVVNCLKCRPPENRDPSEEELRLCEDYLLRQLTLIDAKLLCVLGRYAATVLLRRTVYIMKERGTWQKYNDRPLFICLHPAAILHQPNNRQYFERDIATLIKAYHELKAKGS